jgi:hypothetical protein
MTRRHWKARPMMLMMKTARARATTSPTESRRLRTIRSWK